MNMVWISALVVVKREPPALWEHRVSGGVVSEKRPPCWEEARGGEAVFGVFFCGQTDDQYCILDSRSIYIVNEEAGYYITHSLAG